MDLTLFHGVGLIAKAIAELCLADTVPQATLGKSYAFTDFLQGLGSLGLHTSIIGAMQQAPPVAAHQYEPVHGVVTGDHIS